MQKTLKYLFIICCLFSFAACKKGWLDRQPRNIITDAQVWNDPKQIVGLLANFYALFHSMKEALARGERIELRGFGVFVVKPRKRGVGRNPRTGEEVAIPQGKTIRFKPGKELQAHGFTSEEGEDIHDTETPLTGDE